jgi:hypothetical protein
MSTEYIRDEVEVARAALGKLTAKAEKRLRDVRNTRKGFDTERVRVARGAQLAMRGIDDLDEVYEEEEQQLAPILEPRTIEPEPTPEPPADATPSLEPPTPLEPGPVPEATQLQSVAVTRNPRGYNPRCWTRLQWLCAAIGLTIGLVIGSARSDFDKFHGFGHGVFTFVWVIAVAGVGFFGGGLIGSFIEERWNNRTN